MATAWRFPPAGYSDRGGSRLPIMSLLARLGATEDLTLLVPADRERLLDQLFEVEMRWLAALEDRDLQIRREKRQAKQATFI